MAIINLKSFCDYSGIFLLGVRIPMFLYLEKYDQLN